MAVKRYHTYHLTPGESIEIGGFTPEDTATIYAGETDGIVERLNEELNRYKVDAMAHLNDLEGRGREVEELRGRIEHLKTDLHNRNDRVEELENVIDTQDNIIRDQLKVIDTQDDIIRNQLNEIRALQGRRPFEYPHPSYPVRSVASQAVRASSLEKIIEELRAKLSRRDSAVNQLENQIRALQGQRPVSSGPRFTRGGKCHFSTAPGGSWNRTYYINDGDQRVAEFKSRGLRDRVLDDLNE